MAPVAGSAYTYAYTTMGELFAWIIGWDLVLEYAVGAATVANGWSGYFQSVLLKIGLVVPIALSGAPHKYDQGQILPNVYGMYEGSKVTQKVLKLATVDGVQALKQVLKEPTEGSYWVRVPGYTPIGRVDDPAITGKVKDVEEVACWVRTQDDKNPFVAKVGDIAAEAKIQNLERAYINAPAILVVLIVTIILVKGISESAGFNAAMVAIKVLAVLFVIIVGAFYVKTVNWTNDFAPKGWTGVSFFGIPVFGQSNAAGEPVGVLAGAAIIFFAYIGFDSVSTHAEEARNPQRDVPIGIITSLLICTVLYIGVVAVLTGMVPYQELSKDAGVSDAFHRVGLDRAEAIIAVAGVAGITSVLLVMMLSAPRVFLAMARDGLVPTNPKVKDLDVTKVIDDSYVQDAEKRKVADKP